MNKTLFFEQDYRGILLHSLELFKEQILPMLVEDAIEETTVQVNEMIDFLELIYKKEEKDE